PKPKVCCMISPRRAYDPRVVPTTRVEDHRLFSSRARRAARKAARRCSISFGLGVIVCEPFGRIPSPDLGSPCGVITTERRDVPARHAAGRLDPAVRSAEPELLHAPVEAVPRD